jgi:hypothetical protein
MNMDEERKVKKISISLSNEVLEWVLNQKGDLKVSTFINQILRDKMDADVKSPCNICDDLMLMKTKLKRLEKEVHELVEVRSLKAGKLGKAGHISILSTRPRDVFGQLVNIRNVSAKNAMAVYEELIPFMQDVDLIDREIVLKGLFPHTRSGITNEINYWYNACRGILDHLIEEGSVVCLSKNKYRWIGDKKSY